jgi:hypothetical protein
VRGASATLAEAEKLRKKRLRNNRAKEKNRQEPRA